MYISLSFCYLIQNFIENLSKSFLIKVYVISIQFLFLVLMKKEVIRMATCFTFQKDNFLFNTFSSSLICEISLFLCCVLLSKM